MRFSTSPSRRYVVLPAAALLLAAIGMFVSTPPKAIQAAQGEQENDPEPVVALLELLIDVDADTARQCMDVLAEKIQTRELAGEQLGALKPRLESALRGALETGEHHPLYYDAALLAASLKNEAGLSAARKLLQDEKQPHERRLRSLDALIAAKDGNSLPAAAEILRRPQATPQVFRGAVVAAIGRSADPQAAQVVLASYEHLEAELKPKAIEVLTQRAAGSKSLLHAVAEKKIPASALNFNHVAKLAASPDPEVRRLATEQWGAVRTERNPQREQVIAEVRQLLQETPADAGRGEIVFQKVCGQCHKIYDRGQEVGPDITSNGRASLDQLLSNVLDPSLVIGASYQARTIITTDGRVLTGLLTEDSTQRIVLKMQGGKLETIARDDVEELHVSKLSLMPEGLEKQLQTQELADLFAFITLDRHPDDPQARYIPGAGPPPAGSQNAGGR